MSTTHRLGRSCETRKIELQSPYLLCASSVETRHTDAWADWLLQPRSCSFQFSHSTRHLLLSNAHCKPDCNANAEWDSYASAYANGNAQSYSHRAASANTSASPVALGAGGW
jgi:hypothetical protein